MQTGKYGENLGELVITLDGNSIKVDSYKIYPIDDTILGDRNIGDEIASLKKTVTDVVFASRGFSIDQPLAIAPRGLPNTFSDIGASTILANLCTDAFRSATGADIGFTANGLMRSGLTRGKTGIQTVYDVFAVAPLGAGVLDPTAGNTLVTAYFTGRDLKNILEFLLIDNPAHPGEYFPRTSGMRFTYDPARPELDVVIGIEVGDLDRGYRSIDIGGDGASLYSLTCPLYFGLILVAIPKNTRGRLAFVPKKKNGQPMASKIEALADPRHETPYLLPPAGTVDPSSVNTVRQNGAITEIKEWQAIMDHLRALPAAGPGALPIIPIDERSSEVRAIRGT
ncbi:MAG: 5'-nucleotidase C-terminal domain-containing protein [Proteobacteria bacterium]|nr:5'-nucleotidase C-terminal domain-containing protein [Pseudomonadota bacterium]